MHIDSHFHTVIWHASDLLLVDSHRGELSINTEADMLPIGFVKDCF
jgi:hypothetical protein